MASKSEGWYYLGKEKELKGKLIGPFSSAKMREWFEGGYLPGTLQVKFGMDADFKELRDLGQNVFKPGFEKSDAYKKLTQSRKSIVRRRRAAFKLESFHDDADVVVPSHPKSDEERKKILESLRSNFMFKSLSQKACNLAVDAMEKIEMGDGENIMKQGDSGDDFFVMTEGKVTFYVGVAKVGEAEGLTSFGELALVYNSPRNATVKCASKCILWRISRAVFRKALSEESTAKHLKHIKMLTEVPSLASLSANQINKIAGAIAEKKYNDGDVIVEQGDKGEKEGGQKFYIISSGKVQVKGMEDGKIKFEKMLTTNEFFGERALITKEGRNATCTAVGSVTCCTLSAQDFTALLGSNEDIQSMNKSREAEDTGDASKTAEADSKSLEEYKVLRIIGQGTFGRVKLAQEKKGGLVVAIKCLQKVQIVQMKQVQNVLSEKSAMEAFDHPFVLKLLGKAQDSNQLYLVLEICQGGELWSLLYQSRALGRTAIGGFQETHARLYAAEVISGLGYIHDQGYMYRDLKPENLMIDRHGFLKIVDFGFCKPVPLAGKKSQTLCGTPEYLSPELVLQRGHNQCVDYWAFGCLVYELLTNDTPFADPSQNRIFKKIVNSEKLMPHLFMTGFPTKAKRLIEKLLQQKPSQRLGMQSKGPKDILNHPWFEGINWEKLEGRRYKAPYVPKIKDALDDSNFDDYGSEDKVMKYSGNQNLFKKF